MGCDMITQEFLQSVLDYKDGVLYWRKNISNVKAGSIAGNQRQDGYIDIGIKGKLIRSHRLVWLWHHGFMPEFIDHINGIRNDNRIENLRVATRTQNQMNIGKRSNNSTGVTGVTWHKAAKKWMASIQSNKKLKYLGLFEKFDDAVSVRKNAQKELFGEFERKQ